MIEIVTIDEAPVSSEDLKAPENSEGMEPIVIDLALFNIKENAYAKEED